MKEIWKDIKGFEGLYQVSNLGNVKSLERTLIRKNGTRFFVRERMLIQTNDHGGYPYVTLTLLKNKKVRSVHRLVAESFIPNTENKPEIDHIDGNPSNPMVDNLRWVTSTENHLNPITVERRQKSACPIGKGLNARRVLGTSIQDGSTVFFDRMKDAINDGFCPSSISACVRGIQKQHKGYTWTYADSKP
jgi:hypothetical protein